MSEVRRIEDQLRRSFEGEAWHGPAVIQALEGVLSEQAASRPVPAAHSIWEIVRHVTATQQLVLRRLGGNATPLSPEEDWPAVSDSVEAAWQRDLADLRQSYEDVREALAQLSDQELDDPILPDHSSFYVTLHGLVQHNLYHAGQIAVLKKA